MYSLNLEQVAMIIDVHSEEEIREALDTISKNTDLSYSTIRDLPKDPIDAFRQIKFDPIGSHPLESRPLNFVEQLNQTFTYIVALKAASLLLKWHPLSQGLRLAPGAHAPRGTLNIESIEPGIIGAETFAAVKLENNQKLAEDLKKLNARKGRYRYVFFMSPDYSDTCRVIEKEKFGVEVWSIRIPQNIKEL